MKRLIPVTCLVLFLGLHLGTPVATAQEASAPETPAQTSAGRGAGWAFSLGAFDVIDSDKAVEGGIEYRFDGFRWWLFDLNPMVGFSATDQGSYWGYGGFRWDVPVGGDSRLVPTIGFAVSLYEQGDGKNLGGVVEFRSSFQLAYKLDNGSRLGLEFYHLSNARIYRVNPGSESLVLTWSLDL